MNVISNTPFSAVYDNFLSRITDDMYLELSELETYSMMEDLLVSAIQKFEFPRVNLNDYEIEGIEDEGTYCGVESDYLEVRAIIYSDGQFNVHLTQEEIGILAIYMVVEWIGYQLASVENVRMKYSGVEICPLNKKLLFKFW